MQHMHQKYVPATSVTLYTSIRGRSENKWLIAILVTYFDWIPGEGVTVGSAVMTVSGGHWEPTQ